MLYFLFAMVFGISQSESFREFNYHGSGNPEYVLVHQLECASGLRATGFAFTPTDTVLFKQLNVDGSVGSICEEYKQYTAQARMAWEAALSSRSLGEGLPSADPHSDPF